MITPKKILPDLSNKYVNQYGVLEKALTSTSELIHIIDVATLKPIYGNSSILNLLGYTDQQIKKLGAQWPEILTHKDDYEHLSKHILNFRKVTGTRKSRVVYRVKNPQGEYVICESISTPLTSKETLEKNYILSISRIISEHEIQNFSHYDHRCITCNKLLGKELQPEIIEIKCDRCGEFNSIASS